VNERVVQIERSYDAPAAAVFDAWINPEVMRRWFHCESDWETPEAEVDLRIGGRIRVVMRRPDGTDAGAEGEFTLIDRPRRLAMIWRFDDDPSNEQVLDISFAELGGATTVRLLNTGISTDERRDGQDWGWRGCLEQLSSVMRA
jgi:uncharacterized protein YndB with AHSA1/START domain